MTEVANHDIYLLLNMSTYKKQTAYKENSTQTNRGIEDIAKTLGVIKTH
jgi:hypothetical protein